MFPILHIIRTTGKVLQKNLLSIFPLKAPLLSVKRKIWPTLLQHLGKTIKTNFYTFTHSYRLNLNVITILALQIHSVDSY